MRFLASLSTLVGSLAVAFTSLGFAAGADEAAPPKPSSTRRGAGGFRAKFSEPVKEATEAGEASPAEASEAIEAPQMPTRFNTRRKRPVEPIEEEPAEAAAEEEVIENDSLDEEAEIDDESTVYGEAVLKSKPKIAPPAELELLAEESSPPEANEPEESDEPSPELATREAETPQELEAPSSFSRLSPAFEVQPAAGQIDAAGDVSTETTPLREAAPAGGKPGAAAAALLDRWLKAPQQRALAGKSLTLQEAIAASAGDRSRQLAIVKSYWTAACQIAAYHQALKENQTCLALGEPESNRDRAAWQAGRSLADARLLEAELAAVEAQQELALACGWSLDQPAPLPADPPFVGNYATRSQALFQGRSTPENVRRIDRTLPLVQRVIDARAAAATALETALAEQVRAYGAGEATIGDVHAASAELRAARGEFLDVVRTYNHTIADYALYVATPGLDHSLVVKMLIVEKTPPSVLKQRPSSLVAEQGAEPAARVGKLERPLSGAASAPQSSLPANPLSPARPPASSQQFVPRKQP